jgi:hypothetical protein
MKMTTCLLVVFLAAFFTASCSSQEEPGLVGYWKLQGDSRDYSGNGHHGVNHGVDLKTLTSTPESPLKARLPPAIS